MTNPELQLELVLLLEGQPTRSADVHTLHHQVRERLGPRAPSLAELYREIRANASFLVLERASGLDPELETSYGAALDAAGLRSAPRVVLACDEMPSGDPLALVAGSLRTLLERAPAVAASVAAAFEDVDRLAARCGAGLRTSGTAPSTTPPPGPRDPGRTARRPRRPAASRLRPGGSR